MKFITEVEVDLHVVEGDGAAVDFQQAHRIVRNMLRRSAPFAYLMEGGLVLRAVNTKRRADA